MTVVTELFPQAQIQRQFWRGTVASTPTDLSDKIAVVVPSFDASARWEGCRWSPRGSDMPARGDDCLVILDSKGDPWVIEWWPFG